MKSEKRMLKSIVSEEIVILKGVYFSESPNIDNFEARNHDWNVLRNGIEIKSESLYDENRDRTEYASSPKRNSVTEPRPKISVRNHDHIVKVPPN